MESLAPGDPVKIGKYWLAGRLGAGGQGVVYEAYDDEGGRYALKVLHAEVRDRLAKEAAAARRVASFCTARVIDADPAATPPYIVSEYVEGVDLRRAGRRFAGDDLHRLATAVATALTAIHEAGVVHRDLKPDNVLLGPDGPRVIDFGIARTEEMSRTAGDYIAGTPTYMAPEVYSGGRAGTAADVFAWGGIMVFAATGLDPFRAETLAGVMHRVLTFDPDLGALPEPLRPLVAAALSKDPGRRPTARGLLLALVGGAHDPLGEGSQRGDGLRAAAADPGLGTLAEDAYDLLTPDQRELVPDLLLRLITIDGDGTETVRRASVADLLPERPAERKRILDVFGYILTERDGEVSIVRPAVLRAWPRLRGWVEADRRGLGVLPEISRAAHAWHEHGRKDGDLFQGSRLEAVLDWAATGRHQLTLTPLERDFLAAASGVTRRRAGRRRLLTTALAVLLVVAVIGAGVAVQQGRQAAEQRDQVAAERDRARGRELIHQADDLRTVNPVRAMLLSLAAWRLAPGPDTRSSLTSAVYQRESTAFSPPADKGAATQAVSGDGRVLAAVSERGVRVYEVATGRQVASWTSPRLAEGVYQVALSRTGRLLAIAVGQAVTVWQTRTGRLVGVKNKPGDDPELLHPDFGDQDSLLSISVTNGVTDLWDAEHGREIPTKEWDELTQFTVASSGRLVAIVTPSGETVRVWRLPGMRRVPALEKGCGTEAVVGFSADSRLMYCAGQRFQLRDTASGRLVADSEAEEDGLTWGDAVSEAVPGTQWTVRLSADNQLVAGARGQRVWVWDVTTHEEILKYEAPGEVTDVWFDPTGRTLRYRVDERIVGLALRPSTASTRPPSGTQIEAISPDARRLLISTSSAYRAWDVAARRSTASYPNPGNPTPWRFSPDGDSLVFQDGEAIVAYSLTDGRRLWSFGGIPAFLPMGGAYSRDGRLFAAVFAQNNQKQDDFRLRVWDARTGKAVSSVKLPLVTRDFVFLADGKTIASASGQFYDIMTGKPVGTGFGAARNQGYMVVDPAGRRLATHDGRRLSLWDLSARQLLVPDLRVAGLEFDTVVFAPGGDVIAASDVSGGLHLWDVATRQPLGGEIRLDSSGIMHLMAFTGDGGLLRVVGASERVHDLPVAPEAMAGAVCARAGRTLSPQEWRDYLGATAYRDVCAKA
ncbi:WD40 repeat domain-containing serine/threonine-protein kinase [Nonomuraea sp. NPDC005650]|uniref:WD40 repeat domain-containing serine/threonine-protein kinase n=1 Tax=Nonomuraea sp. NPDC005650 TaxID=3157045 RepID=UPI0033BDA4C4